MIDLLALALVIAAIPPPAPADPPTPAVPARPLRPIPSLFTGNDYPVEAQAFNIQGSAQYDAIVGVDGRIHRCRILRASSIRLFGAVTCEILRRRARFQPARDAAGNPIEDVVTGTISWGLPTNPQPVPRPR